MALLFNDWSAILQLRRPCCSSFESQSITAHTWKAAHLAYIDSPSYTHYTREKTMKHVYIAAHLKMTRLHTPGPDLPLKTYGISNSDSAEAEHGLEESEDDYGYLIQCARPTRGGKFCGTTLGYLARVPVDGPVVYGNEQVVHIELTRVHSPIAYLEFHGYTVAGVLPPQSLWYIVHPDGYWYDEGCGHFRITRRGRYKTVETAHGTVQQYMDQGRRPGRGAPADWNVFDWMKDRSGWHEDDQRRYSDDIKRHIVGTTGFLPLVIRCPRCGAEVGGTPNEVLPPDIA